MTVEQSLFFFNVNFHSEIRFEKIIDSLYHFKIHVHSNVSTYQDRVVARVRINKTRNFRIVVPALG